MTVGILIPIPREFVLTAAANTLAGAELYVYENLTTTPVTLYSDRACTTPAANPIVSVAGFFPRRYMAAAQLLTLTLKNTAGSTIHSDDYVAGCQEADADLLALASTGGAAWTKLASGLALSNNASDATNDIDVSAGIAIDATNAQFMTLGASITKRLDASWAVGTGNGGLDTGSIANTTYAVWLIMRSDTGLVDVLFSTSFSSPTMPASYDYKRYIGCIVRTGGAIKAFRQSGDGRRRRYVWESPTLDINTSNPGTSAVTATLTLPVGRIVEAELLVGIKGDSNNVNCYISNPAQADVTPSGTIRNANSFTTGVGQKVYINSTLRVRSNASAQVRYRFDASGANDSISINTLGFEDEI